MNLPINISSLDENSKELFQENDEPYRYPESLGIFSAVMVLVFAFLGCVGNSVTIIALSKDPKLRDIPVAFISSLCLADLAVCLLVLPLDAIGYVDASWTESRTLCMLVPFLRYANGGIALLSITAITLNRYIKIIHHSNYTVIYQTRWIVSMIGFMWVFSYGTLLPPWFEIWGKFGHNPSKTTCTIVQDSRGLTPKTCLFATSFLVTTVFIVTCYARIIRVVKRSEKKMRQHNVLLARVKSMHISRSPTGEGERKRTELRLLKMVLVIFLSFVTCHLPTTLVNTLDPRFKYQGIHLVGGLLYYSSFCVNPIIYGVMNEHYRKAYAGVVCCWRASTVQDLP